MYVIDGTRTAIAATTKESLGPTKRRARRYAGTATSDITSASITSAAWYDHTGSSKRSHAGAMSVG